MNRSTIFEFLRKDTPLELRYTKIGKGNYPVLRCPWDWDESYLLINEWMVTNFQAVILFSNELVVRFGISTSEQINIPYRVIDYIEVQHERDVGYACLHQGKKKYH